MKTLKNFLTIFTLLLLSISCNKDDDTPTPAPASIIGKWEYLKAETKDGNTTISSQNFDPLPNCVRNFLLFKADNTLDDVIHTGICTPNTQNFNYTYANTILNFGNIDRKIENLTNNQLVYSYPTGQFRTFYTFQKAP